jgi:hypothetical protein
MSSQMNPRDDAEIRNLIARMAWLTDKWTSPQEYLVHCCDDYSWQIEGMPAYVGHQRIALRLKEMLDLGVCGPGLPTRHCVSSSEVIAQADADTAAVRSFIIMMSQDKNLLPLVLGYGEYHDQVRREHGRWLMAKRYCISFWAPPS